MITNARYSAHVWFCHDDPATIRCDRAESLLNAITDMCAKRRVVAVCIYGNTNGIADRGLLQSRKPTCPYVR